MKSLNDEAREIQEYLELTCSNEPNEIIGRISDLSVYMARSGEMLALAKRQYNKKVTSEIGQLILEMAKKNYLSATTQNALVKSIAEEEKFLMEWIERINRSCTHQIDALRSLLSYEKESLRLNNTGY